MEENQVQQRSQDQTIVHSILNDNVVKFSYKLSKHLVLKKPLFTFLWLTGLYIFFFCTGSTKTQVECNELQESLSYEKTLLDQQNQFMIKSYEKYQELNSSIHGCVNECQTHLNEYNSYKEVYDVMNEQYNKNKNELRSCSGIWSQYSVQEFKKLYKKISSEGLVSFWPLYQLQMLLEIILSIFSEESVDLSFISVFFYFIYNYFIQNIVSFLRFTWSMITVIGYYNPSSVEGGIFVILALGAIISWLVFYYFLILIGFKTVGDTIYYFSKDAIQKQKIEQENAQRIFEQLKEKRQ